MVPRSLIQKETKVSQEGHLMCFGMEVALSNTGRREASFFVSIRSRGSSNLKMAKEGFYHSKMGSGKSDLLKEKGNKKETIEKMAVLLMESEELLARGLLDHSN